jgi:4-hydroxy-tetrahydrodipicolinate reductase
MTTSVAIVGATGTMGQLAARVIDASDEFEVTAKLNSSSDHSDMLVADVVFDVSIPPVSPIVVKYAVDHGRNVLVGTSGWSADRLAILKAQVSMRGNVGVIVIPNFSLGSALATHFATKAGRFFDSIEIVETHHAAKIDSPSGTAVRTAELIEQARSHRGPLASPHMEQRARGELISGVPVHSLRMRGVTARQDVVFGGLGETLTISHQTTDSSSYEAGIILGLRAAVQARGVTVGLDSLIDDLS